MGLQGSIPEDFRHMISLTTLDLSGNNLEGGIPKFFGNMCSLHELDMSSNNLRGEFSGFVQNLSSGCTANSLEILRLDNNEFTGSLNETLTQSIGHMFKLEVLSLGRNSLEGVISEAFFSNLSNLRVLDLSDNFDLALEISHDWVPPFQLDIIQLGSGKMGPHFPKWLQTQVNYSLLDISNAGISDTVPDWLWDQFPRHAVMLNLSHNQMNGRIPDISSKSHLDAIDVSSNNFEGPIPPLPSNSAFSINLSNNKFLGSVHFLCLTTYQWLSYMDLSTNLLSGSLPNCWMQLNSLSYLNLANNNFSEEIPDSIGYLGHIQTLSLSNNSFSGEIPAFLKNCTQLKLIDLSKNAISEKIPEWIGESLPNLVVLNLKSNRFKGNIPFQLCYLAHIQILDISLNNISGTIPKCFNNFTAMTQETHVFLGNGYGLNYANHFSIGTTTYDQTFLMWKGSEHKYKNTLGLVKILDLSSNNLGGVIPGEIMSLVGLIALNLSRNNLIGQIPPKIGQLKSLDFLDFSRNKLSGEIPGSLSQIDRLGVLDLSNNNLSGKMPSSTQLQSFNASSYARNPQLCGLPLHKCQVEAEQTKEGSAVTEDEDQFISQGFYVSMVLGFIIAFWGVCGTLILKRSWRHAYFKFLIDIKERLHVTTVVNIVKLRRRFSN